MHRKTLWDNEIGRVDPDALARV